jgi:hypothetical protein
VSAEWTTIDGAAARLRLGERAGLVMSAFVASAFLFLTILSRPLRGIHASGSFINYFSVAI